MSFWLFGFVLLSWVYRYKDDGMLTQEWSL